MDFYNNSLIKNIIEWDVLNWSKALYFWENFLLKKEFNFQNKLILDIGCRNGGLSLWCALKGGRVYCSDIHGPSKEAIKLHNKYKVQRNITYCKIDVLNICYPPEKFDMVIFKSVLGGLRTKENQYQAINEIFKVLKPGGLLLFAENLKASFIHRIIRKIFTQWGHYWRYVDINEIRDFFKSYEHFEYGTYGFFSCFGKNEKNRAVLSKIDKIFNIIIPQRFKYIIFGIAIK